MKATLEFNTDKDALAFRRATCADNMAFALFDILLNMRKALEWKELDAATIEAAVDFVHEIAAEQGINIETLVE